MRIECTIRRDGGTVVTFDQRSRERLGLPPGSYHFKPVDPADPDSPHVAAVENPAHRDRFLTIRAYRVFDRDPVGAASAVKAPTLSEAPSTAEAAAVDEGSDFDATAFQRQSVRALREALPGLSVWQIREVMHIEESDSEPRQSVIDALMARLRALEA